MTNQITTTTNSGSSQIGLGVLIVIMGIAIGFMFNQSLIMYAVIIIGIGMILSSFLIIVKQYQRAIILRLGKYSRSINAGIQTRIPFVDSVLIIDIREKVTEFAAESMLTQDNVPVTIDAILRYKVMEDQAKDAILNVEHFDKMIEQTSQVTLRNHIGSNTFQDILAKREEVNTDIKKVLESEVGKWGLAITGVEIRQVKIPPQLENAMSQQAQAEREKNARTIYGESEVLVAKKFAEASETYEKNPTAYALRQSNMLYESLKIKGNTIIMIPSESINGMGFGNLAITKAYLDKNKEAMHDKKESKTEQDSS